MWPLIPIFPRNILISEILELLYAETVVKVEILRWVNCTCTLGPPVSACGPPVDSCKRVIIELQSIYSFKLTKTVRLFFNRCTVLRYFSMNRY